MRSFANVAIRYVATEEGIFAFEINIEERKQWPAVKLK